MADWPAWPRNNRKLLARYVTPEAAAQVVTPDFFRQAARREGASTFHDLVATNRTRAVAAIYEQLRQTRVDYALEPLLLGDPDHVTQEIRSPEEVLAPRNGKGTCLDLALLFAGLCLYERLAPLVVLLERSGGRGAHALVVVDVDCDAEEWERSKTYFRDFEEGLLPGSKGGELIQRLVAHDYLVGVECTGFAHTRAHDGRMTDTFPWDEAKQRARQHLADFEHLVTINVAALRYLGEHAYEPGEPNWAKEIKRIADITRYKFVANPLSVGGSIIDDHSRRDALIRLIKAAFDQTDQELTPDLLYTYGRSFMVANLLDLSEACLLELQHQFPERTEEALATLSTLYQRRAHEYIIQKNFGLAEQVLLKAQKYVKAAIDAVDIACDPSPFHLQWAYGYKELGLAYSHPGSRKEAAFALRKARQLFGGVLAVEKTNVSALNGMGSVEIIEGNIEEGINYVARAVEFEPNYVEAWYDLAQAYLALSRNQVRHVISSKTRRKGVDAYLRVKDLIRKGVSLPREAEKYLDELYSSVPEFKMRKREARGEDTLA